MNKFKNATVVITGAGSGIGRELANVFAEAGANLALSDINLDAVNATAAKLQSGSAQVAIHALDVSDKQAVFDYAEQIASDFGEINLVINNAGVALNTGTMDSTSIEEYEWLMGINFWGVLYGTKAFLPHLNNARWGHVVNISSLFGLIGVPGQSAYNAAKFGVRGFTEALRQELDITSQTVSCTSVHPGGIKTDIAKNSRQGTKEPSENDKLFMGDADDFEKLARTTARSAAEQIAQAVIKDKRRLLIGFDAKLLDWVQRHFPNYYQKLFMYLKNRMEK